MSQKRDAAYGIPFQLEDSSPLETVLPHPWHEPCLTEALAANLKESAAHDKEPEIYQHLSLEAVEQAYQEAVQRVSIE